jgi:hypothetical protein
MRITLCILLMAYSLLGMSQNLDSLKQRILKIELEQRSDDYRMHRFTKQYSNGTWLLIAGTATTLINWFVQDRLDNDNHFPHKIETRKQIGFVLGGALIVGGTALQIDAHRHLKKPRTKKARLLKAG